MNAPDHNRSVTEPESLRPRLRDGLLFSVQQQGAERICVIEDRQAWRFHRIGLDEYRFIRALDGTRTVASILAAIARDRGGESFTENEALQIVRWLKDNHLLALESDRAQTAPQDAAQALLGALTWLNPLVARLPLARPDRFFARLAALFSPVLGLAGLGFWCAVVLAGAAAVALEWPRFTRDFDGILARDNWLWLLTAWAGLKIIHELAHGIFCRHFGGAVREIGAIFVLFIPMGYVDASASLALASRWRRIVVAAAGIYAEFFLAALAALYWSRTPDGLAANLAHNVIFTGTVATLAVNANPLMRFDGYYILSDLLGIPNLATRGRHWLRGVFAWLLLGRRTAPPARLRHRDDFVVALYAVASLLWQVAVFAGMLVIASTTLRGGGVFFAVIAGALWIAAPVGQLFGAIAQAKGSPVERGLAVAWRLAVCGALVATVLLAPFRRGLTGHGVVELPDTMTLRAECPGFVKKVHVRDGALVAEGALLVELENEDAAVELARAELELARQEAAARIARARGDIAAAQAETAKADGLRTSLETRRGYLATLQVRAPFAGRVTGRLLERLDGAYLRSGEEIAQLGRATGAEVRLALDQEAASHFREAVGQPVRIWVEGHTWPVPAQLTRVEARATRGLIHPALTALSGGPLPVRRADEPAGRRDSPEYELAEPHFTALARFEAADRVGIGQLALVKLRSVRGISLWQSSQLALARWLQRHSAAGD